MIQNIGNVMFKVGSRTMQQGKIEDRQSIFVIKFEFLRLHVISFIVRSVEGRLKNDATRQERQLIFVIKCKTSCNQVFISSIIK